LLRAAVWLAVLVILLVLSPSEQTLGQVVKLVYLHGALVRTGLLAFTAAGILGLIALVTRRDWAIHWGRATGHAALLVWIVYVLSSMVVTYLAWGVAIAWGEPRVRVSAQILIAALAFWVVSLFLRDWRADAALDAVLGALAWILIRGAGVVIHPVDPIGGSSSAAIKAFYAGIVACVILLAGDLTVWLKRRVIASEAKQSHSWS
jgi:FtsH-binding integral membrane protein